MDASLADLARATLRCSLRDATNRHGMPVFAEAGIAALREEALVGGDE